MIAKIHIHLKQALNPNRQAAQKPFRNIHAKMELISSLVEVLEDLYQIFCERNVEIDQVLSTYGCWVVKAEQRWDNHLMDLAERTRRATDDAELVRAMMEGFGLIDLTDDEDVACSEV